MPLDLPAASTHRLDEEADSRLTIQIADDGVVQIGSTPVAAEQIADRLAEHQRNHSSAAAVRIRTDKTVLYGVVEPLLRDIAAAGIVDITFAVREEI